VKKGKIWNSMLSCPECKALLAPTHEGYTCTRCGHGYEQREGIVQLSGSAPETQDYYPDDAFEILYHAEEKSFWFNIRNRIIRDAISRYLATGARILEVGCGTGFVSYYLKQCGFHMECSDLFFKALQFCRERDSGHAYYQYDLADEIFSEEFDGICAFDVLEHIEDDSRILRHIHDALKPSGLVFITVPAGMRLWSAMDEYAEHKRRYSLQDLRKKLEANRFKVVKMTYFMTLLLPVLRLSRKYVSRKKSRKGNGDNEAVKREAMKELHLNPVVNYLFGLIFSLEIPMIRSLDFPCGSSILCIAMKE